MKGAATSNTAVTTRQTAGPVYVRQSSREVSLYGVGIPEGSGLIGGFFRKFRPRMAGLDIKHWLPVLGR